MALEGLIHTRSLMAPIAPDGGLERHVLSPTLFTPVAFVAAVTTVATTPVLDGLR